MSYEDTLDWLYSQTPAFHKLGAHAYKPGHERVNALAAALGDPHKQYRTVHVAGTNGKGSTVHSLAAVLQSAGLKTGLFTSPHLVDFRERIRIDGQMIGKDEVTGFIERSRADIERLEPSFFELTTMMAFDAFARHGIDVAVIEVGLGGRLDSTNIITPDLCVITSISLDHTEQLGSTLAEIAREKAGIIKPGVPVVISGQPAPEVREVFEDVARDKGASIYFADDETLWQAVEEHDGKLIYKDTPLGTITSDLTGLCQPFNMAGILKALQLLDMPEDAVKRGLADVTGLTGLMGRWMTMSKSPLVVCDTGHNEGGWEQLARQIDSYEGEKHLVLGFVADKDLGHIFPALKQIHGARYYWTQPSTPRALSSCDLQHKARVAGLNGSAYPDVPTAVTAALYTPSVLTFIGGSNFVVGDYLANR